MARKRIKKHDLTAWFLEDHAALPANYVKSCEKFFKELAEERGKLQAEEGSTRHNLFTAMLDKNK